MKKKGRIGLFCVIWAVHKCQDCLCWIKESQCAVTWTDMVPNILNFAIKLEAYVNALSLSV